MEKSTVAKLAALITTLAEVNGSPESQLYMFFDMNMQLWSEVREVLVSRKLISICNHYVTLTPDGVKLAHKLNDVWGNNQ